MPSAKSLYPKQMSSMPWQTGSFLLYSSESIHIHKFFSSFLSLMTLIMIVSYTVLLQQERVPGCDHRSQGMFHSPRDENSVTISVFSVCGRLDTFWPLDVSNSTHSSFRSYLSSEKQPLTSEMNQAVCHSQHGSSHG